MTRWLTEDEQRTWRSFLTVNRKLFAALERQLQVDAGIPHTYYEVLVSLSEAPGRTLRMSDLADRSRSSRSRMSHAVARLEEAGWVRRDTCPNDRRGSFAVLTGEGYEVLAGAAPGHVEAVRSLLFDAITPAQAAQLGEICEAVANQLRELGDDGEADCAPGNQQS